MSDIEVADAAEPVDEVRNARLAALTAKLGGSLVGSHIRPHDELWIRVSAEAWADTFRLLREAHGCTFFNWLSAIDWLPSPYGRELDAEVDNILEGREPKDPGPMVSGYAGGDTRFQVFARVNNLVERWAIIVKADVPDDTLTVPTITAHYAGANWHEREAAEMYGITFAGHPDLRKLYLPSGFEGHPLRKDYPLLARRVKPWPGIVDVEPMPGDDEGDEGGEG